MAKALGFVIVAALLAGGLIFWLTLTPTPPPAVPLAQVQGTSFDAAPPPKVEEPKPAEPVVVAPSPPPAPAPVAEIKPAPVEPKPVVAEPKPAPPPPPAPEAKPVVAEPKPAPPEPKPVAAAPPVDDKPMMMTFAKLAFRYWPQTKDKGARDPFPKEIKALNGKKIVMDGFMFPIDFEKGKVKSFLLSNGMFGCCFGDAPQITETIKVYRSDGKLMPYQSMARVTGILEVGEEFDADGYVDSVYRIKAEDVAASPATPAGH